MNRLTDTERLRVAFGLRTASRQVESAREALDLEVLAALEAGFGILNTAKELRTSVRQIQRRRDRAITIRDSRNRFRPDPSE